MNRKRLLWCRKLKHWNENDCRRTSLSNEILYDSQACQDGRFMFGARHQRSTCKACILPLTEYHLFGMLFVQTVGKT